MRKKPDIFELLEQTSKEACDQLNELCFSLAERNGYYPRNRIGKCYKEMKRDGKGIVSKYAYQEENILLWWELWTFKGNKPKELLDTSDKLKIVVRKGN